MNERSARAAIVAYGALLYDRRLVFGSSGNLSARLDDGTLLVTPTQRSLRNLALDEIVRLREDGSPFDPEQRPTSELPLHLGAYRARLDVRCVVHTHPTACVAWSKQGGLFPLDTVGALESLGPIAFTPYAKSGTQQLADICTRALAERFDTIVMERHGLSSVAADFETAFLRTELAEQTARIELEAALLRSASKVHGMTSDPAPFPAHELHDAAGDHPEAQRAIDALHAEVRAGAPSAARIDEHVAGLRRFSSILAPLEAWYLDPRTQAFIAELNAAGL